MGSSVWHRELSSRLSDDLEGWDGGIGRLKKEGIYVYIQLIHIVVQQKLAPYCKAIILQQKLNKIKRVTLNYQFLMDQIRERVTLKGQDNSQVQMSLYWEYQYLTDSSDIIYPGLITIKLPFFVLTTCLPSNENSVRISCMLPKKWWFL